MIVELILWISDASKQQCRAWLASNDKYSQSSSLVLKEAN
jgi:hypothetical protein